jgi:hypothetical protein
MFIKRKLEKYLKEHLEEKTTLKERSFAGASSMEYMEEGVLYKSHDINHYIENNMDDNTFQTKLFEYIDEKNLKDSDVYNKVNIDRRLFSKIRSDKNYHPSKETVILLGLALKLSEEEIVDLLESASYSLPMNTTFDLIIRFCFKEHIYNVNKVNEFLYDHECKTI